MAGICEHEGYSMIPNSGDVLASRVVSHLLDKEYCHIGPDPGSRDVTDRTQWAGPVSSCRTAAV
jgi:hypothetical protein